MTRYVAVTGCCGFIGRSVTRQLLSRGDYVYGVDALTYAADPLFPEECLQSSRFCFVGRDISELGRWPDVDAIIHLAAETHVDNSLLESRRFIETNVNGTGHLLEMTRAKAQHGMPRFIYVSTDEVYGDIEWPFKATPTWGLKPSSPYAASKAAADLLVQAYGRTYGLPYKCVRMTNAYGPGQYPEKLIPKTIRSYMLGRPVPVHGNGSQKRQWLHAEDAASAILFTLDNPDILPPIVNVGGNCEASVEQVVTRIGKLMECEPITTPAERPGCDMRYAIDDCELRQAGWKPCGRFFDDLPSIVEWERRSFRF